jgi:tetrahydromethanopterin S-methyltransferase subunit D
VKGILIWVLLGALLGIVAASFIVPPMLSWYNEAGYLAKGGQPAAMVNLPEVVRYATTRLMRGQAIGGLIGAAVFFVLGLSFGGRRKRRAGGPAAAAAAPRVQ